MNHVKSFGRRELDNFFSIIFFLSLIGTGVYLVRFFVYRKKDKKSEQTAKEKKYAAIFAIAMIICFIGYACTMPDDDYSRSESSSKNVESKSSKNHNSSSSVSDGESSSSNDSSADTAAKISKQYNDDSATQNASKYSYGELVKSSNHYGESFKLSNATVYQAQENNNTTYLLVYINDDSDELYSVALAGMTPAIEDDIVNVQGLLGELDSYDTKAGGSNTVPNILSSNVEVTGHISDAD